ncbi:tRNA lysidine(34) synthetase TilS [Aceticella autotrophica]|uniref:tRNA(Ile)-lysidine synthase n=1 Tax=Aceticella autotrophica TaxID=2755338 RepID=A0A975GAL7_9THEO|nr:tRNA lysidine(34) synthetase TilS [Aceticella autotrophica]QSZ27222.1 tRNA lysidine(34) synthetase TilS [Aceticella autotrophica]
MVKKVLNTIKKYDMIQKNDTIVVGVSGGPDSICLLNILYELKDIYKIKLYVVHINHMLRGKEAEKDAEFVENMCRGMDIPFFLFKTDVKKYAVEMKYSEEQAGREKRYNAFNEILKKVNADKIAVAHNKNDAAETVLLNILRGTGTTGLAGIKPVNGNIIRPLIEISRKQIEDYLREKGLKFVVDRTNYEDKYNRNKVRLRLIPFIEDTFGVDIVENLYRTSRIIMEDNEYLDLHSEKVFDEIAIHCDEEIRLRIDGLIKQHDAVKKRLLRIAYKKLKGDFDGLEYIHIEDILSLLRKQTSARIDLPFGIEVIKSYNNLIFRKHKEDKKNEYCVKLKIPGNTEVSDIGVFKTYIIDTKDIKKIDMGKFCKMFDFDKINGSINIRQRKTGDIIHPLNMKGTKKLKEFFIDEKVPKEMRDNVPILAIGNVVLWVVGYRMSDTYKIDDDTKKILVIKYIKKEPNLGR